MVFPCYWQKNAPPIHLRWTLCQPLFHMEIWLKLRLFLSFFLVFFCVVFFWGPKLHFFAICSLYPRTITYTATFKIILRHFTALSTYHLPNFQSIRFQFSSHPWNTNDVVANRQYTFKGVEMCCLLWRAVAELWHTLIGWLDGRGW